MNCDLFELSLSSNSVTDQGILPLFNSLDNANCKLNALDLSNTKITDKGVQFMCKVLNHENCINSFS